MTRGAVDESGRDLPSAPPATRERRRTRRAGGRNIVVGYDGSEHAERALERAAGVAGTDGTVTLVTAARVLPSTPQAAGTPSLEELREHDRVLEEARTRLIERGVAVRVVDSLADPAQAIVDAARESGADLVVVGTRGRGAAARTLLGSVSAEVLERAPCEVEIV